MGSLKNQFDFGGGHWFWTYKKHPKKHQTGSLPIAYWNCNSVRDRRNINLISVGVTDFELVKKHSQKLSNSFPTDCLPKLQFDGGGWKNELFLVACHRLLTWIFLKATCNLVRANWIWWNFWSHMTGFDLHKNPKLIPHRMPTEMLFWWDLTKNKIR